MSRLPVSKSGASAEDKGFDSPRKGAASPSGLGLNNLEQEGEHMKRVKAYKTTDDRLHENENEAKAHQRKLDNERSIDQWTDRYCFNEMVPSDVAELLKEHGEELGI